MELIEENIYKAANANQKGAKRKEAVRDKNLTYKNELLRLSFRTEELEEFWETRKWIEKGLNHFRNHHTIRPQTKEELRNVAVSHVKERWGVLKRAGKPVTGGLVLRMTVTFLKKYIAKDRTILSYPHPERAENKEDAERLAKIAEDKLSWKQKQAQNDLKMDIENMKDSLTFEGRIVLDSKINGHTNDEIRLRLDAVGSKSVQHLLYEKMEAIKELFKGMGYP